MNQLSTQKDSFEFLPFTDITMESLPEWMGGLYEESFEGASIYETESIIAEYVPTKFMVLNYAYNFYDVHCYFWAMNGNDEFLLSEIQGMHSSGYTLDDIVQEWFETRDYNANYGPPPPDSLECAFMRDINRALNLYHLSYIDDGFEGNIYNCPETVIVKEWINPPIVKVW